jgi:pyruvate/2-oxoglutarate dehydrogenase complex dihydrolipoamide acyltransferase (E2) component
VAVATPKGLVTPVVRNAENMSFIQIEKEIAALGKKARDNKLTLEDMAGGSFTMYVRFSQTRLGLDFISFVIFVISPS